MYLIRKYIIKEMLLHFIAIISLLFIISSSNKFIDLLSKVAGGKLPFFIVGKIMLLSSTEIIALLIPLSLFIATLFVVSKLYADNTIIIIFSTKLGWNFLISTIMGLALIISIITASLTLFISPALINIRDTILAKGQTIGMLHSIIPGHFQVINDGKQVFYIEDLDATNTLHNIFIATTSNKEKPNLVITARSGNIKQLAEEDSNNNLLILKNGHRYSGLNNNNLDFSIINFEEYGRQIFSKPVEVINIHKIQKTKELWNSKNPGEQAELQWRLAIPISVIILTMLAFGLAKVSPRQGRFAKFLPAILLYIVYCNLMLFLRRLVSIGTINNLLGIWIIHLLFLLIAIILLLYSNGWINYFVHLKNNN